MILKLIPYTSLGAIVTSLPRNDVRRTLGGTYKEFFKTPLSKVPTDDFVGKDIHIYYDSSFHCKAVEVFRPNSVEFDTVDLLSTTFENVKRQFEALGYDIKINDSGIECKDLGVSLYCPDMHDSEVARVESVYVKLVS